MSVNRKNDYAFKRIFGHEDSKDILARFLSVVLDVPIEADELTLIQTELSPEFLSNKLSVLDIQVRRSKFHEKLNIEMQQRDEGNIHRKTLQYGCRGFSGELKSGQDYSELPRYISIVIVDFDVFEWKNEMKFHGIFHMRDRDDGVLFSDALEIHILELPKLRRQQQVAGRQWTALECWLHYLDNIREDIMEQIAEREPLIRRAMTIEEAFMADESERYLYEMREKGRHDWDNAMITAEKRGKAEGRVEGKAEGKAEGRVEFARNMIVDREPVEKIMRYTGLPYDEVMRLYNNAR